MPYWVISLCCPQMLNKGQISCSCLPAFSWLEHLEDSWKRELCCLDKFLWLWLTAFSFSWSRFLTAENKFFTSTDCQENWGKVSIMKLDIMQGAANFPFSDHFCLPLRWPLPMTQSVLTASEHWHPCVLPLTVLSLPLRHSQVFKTLFFLGKTPWQRRIRHQIHWIGWTVQGAASHWPLNVDSAAEAPADHANGEEPALCPAHTQSWPESAKCPGFVGAVYG